MARLPSAKYIRIAKVVCSLFPALCLFFGLVFSIGMVIKSEHKRVVDGSSRRVHPVHKNIIPLTLTEHLEKSGLCYLYRDKSGKFNSSEILLKHPYLKNILLNNSVGSICAEYQLSRELYFSPRDVKVNYFNHTFLKNGANVCGSNTDVIVLIHSLHTYFERRNALRETWVGGIVRNIWPGIGDIGARIKVVFVLGIHRNKTVEDMVRKEDAMYHDIIQGDFYESYQNMTLKSLFGLKWVNTFCNRAKYLVKSDDDMIINFPYLIKVLNETNMTRSIMGPYNVGSRVMRKGKWKINHEKYPFYYYPPYESGSAYVISSDLVLPLLELSDYVPRIFIDDVYITGILGKILKVRHINHPGFAFWISNRPTECDIIKNSILTGTKMRPKDLWDIWFKLHGNVQC